VTSERGVASRDVSLLVREHGDPASPTVVLVHGWPDTSRVWDEVVDRLQGRYHVVTYDLRGSGGSTAPRGPRGYSLERLVEDLRNVIVATSPGRPVHLVGHDWGSIQGWDAVTTAAVASKIASYTTISGPSLDHVRPWIERRVRSARLGDLLAQGPRSWYVYFFHGPFARYVVRRVLPRRFPEFLRRVEGLEPREGHPAATLGADAARGVGMYRANIFQRIQRPRPGRTEVPVQLIVATRDAALSPRLFADVERFAPNLWRRRVPAKHWVIRSHPDVVARMIGEFVDHIEGAPASRSLRRARSAPGRKRFADHLVVVTGAGSGIGRATALTFAERGAEVIAADIDPAASSRTAELAALIGPAAHPFEVDVSDRDAMERFAKTVLHDYGVPDVVVNNAGIGLAGPFLRTEFDDWRRILDVNLWGVIHGSLLFGREMVDRAEGGHIVNVASAAAFFPSRALPAYSTSKAAVLMLSECMRGELAASGVGVSAICPGLVNTSITRTSRFVGLSEDEQTRIRREAVRVYGLRNFSPDRVADAILRAVREDQAVVPVAPEAKALRALYRLSPSLSRAVGRIDARPR
jgi:NAD(P)-dependent dehydrogenase (short-subunit alcohol dehydrogenase family)/pimeloyl-ACP methyl ester carboxylesterase